MMNSIWNFLRRKQGKPKQEPEVVNPFKKIQFQANSTSEDRICSGVIKQLDAHYLGVFDGHGGSKVSEYLENNIDRALNSLIETKIRHCEDYETLIKTSLQKIFEIIQKEILQIMNKEALLNNAESPRFQECGSCALLAIVTQTHIYIANSGDSQGLIINSDPSHTSLTNIRHNTHTQSEISRLKQLFPNDSTLFETNNDTLYIKGKLMVTRCLGDFSFKYKPPNRKVISALDVPYITCKPIIKCFKRSSDDKHLLLATDGLWDFLSPEEVQETMLRGAEEDRLKQLVGQCIRKCEDKYNVCVEKLLGDKNRRRYIDDISIVVLDLNPRG